MGIRKVNYPINYPNTRDELNSGGVYSIFCIPEQKIYIGSAYKNVSKRFNQHFSQLNKNKHGNIYLQEAWNKHGRLNFIFEIIVKEEKEFIISTEQFWVNMCNSADRSFGYNINSNCEAHPPQSREFVEKRRKSVLEGYASGKLKSYSREEKHLVNKGKFGKDNPCSKPVLQYDLAGNFIREWENAKIAAKALNISPSGISQCCRGNTKYSKVGGFIWKFKNNNKNEKL